MTDYNELVEALAQVIGESDGNAPDSGVPLMYGPEVYAAYAWNHHYEPSDLEEFYSDAEDSFVGEYISDEEFAENYADELGYLENTEWPYSYIDWERAASDLMMDYWQKNGLYFRSF